MVPGRIASFAAHLAHRCHRWQTRARAHFIPAVQAQATILLARHRYRAVLPLAAALLVAACSSAPVGPGYYRVQRGDTLYSIARQQKQSGADLIRWNSLANPDKIEVDQVLRVTPPTGETALRTRPESTANRENAPAAPTPRPSRRTRNATPAEPAAATAVVTPPASKDIALIWPANGKIVNSFDGNRNKGVDIAGSAGEPVKAAAPGQVAYVGQLRGYGNLLIIKHDNGFLTSYAHLQKTDVKEGQRVSSGQTVASIGNTEAAAPMLHFELRYNGQPVNPTRYLPAR